MNGACFVTGQRVIDLIELGFNDTSTLVGHFVSSPRKRESQHLWVILCRLPEKERREIGDSRGDKREGQWRKENE